MKVKDICQFNNKTFFQNQRMKEMIEKYKQEMPEEEFADFVDIKRGEGKFIVSQLERLSTFFHLDTARLPSTK